MSELFVFSNLVPSSLCYELHVNVPSISLEICICIQQIKRVLEFISLYCPFYLFRQIFERLSCKTLNKFTV